MHWDATTNERVRRWLGSVPRPQAVLGEPADGSPKRRVAVPVRGKLIDVASALDGCVRIEAIDSKDQILRVMDLDDVVKVQQDEPPPDMNRGELGQIARIISAAHEAGAKVANEANKAGNEVVTRLMSLMFDRVSLLEQTVARSLATQQKETDRRMSDLDQREADLAARAEQESEDNGLDGAAKQLVEAAAPAIGAALAAKLFGGGDDKPKPPPAPNGAAS